jgi:hypothetical protein
VTCTSDLWSVAEHSQRRARAIAYEEQLDASQAEDRIAAGDLDLVIEGSGSPR